MISAKTAFISTIYDRDKSSIGFVSHATITDIPPYTRSRDLSHKPENFEAINQIGQLV